MCTFLYVYINGKATLEDGVHANVHAYVCVCASTIVPKVYCAHIYVIR